LGDSTLTYESTPPGIIDTELVFMIRETYSVPHVTIGWNNECVTTQTIKQLTSVLREFYTLG